MRLYVWMVIMTFISCKPRSVKIVESPPGYDFSTPIKFWLPLRLDEISGISVYNNYMYAIQDELGRIYHFRLDSDKILSSKFGSKGDYEDLAILDSTLFILESNGAIHTFPVEFIDSIEVNNVKVWPTHKPNCEYEGIFADIQTKRLYVLSKECIDDKSTQRRSGIIMEWKNDSLFILDSFTVDLELLRKIKGNKKGKFNPSALALHPKTHQWYILSAANGLLLITDEKFIPIQIIKLKESIFSQPEGISFDSSGNLYIANEKGDSFEGRILKFEMKQ